jgi:carboxyvinyl-carboxyphosphonate phosphorylmutase
MLSMRARRERFREILARDKITNPASIYDPVSARMAEDAGFEVAILAGSVATHAVLGAPDVCLITLSEMAEQARRISRASSIPFWIDADHGYGNALSVMRTIEDLDAAGAAAASIEDTDLPQPFGGSGSQLISKEEFAGKLKAAVAARLDPSFVVIGRTSAFARENLDSALRRIEICNEAGVDCIHVSGGGTPENLGAIAAVTKLPIIFNGVVNDTVRALKWGVRIGEWNHVPFSVVIQSLRDAYEHILAGRPLDELRRRAGVSPEVTKLALAEEHYAEAARIYLS